MTTRFPLRQPLSLEYCRRMAGKHVPEGCPPSSMEVENTARDLHALSSLLAEHPRIEAVRLLGLVFTLEDIRETESLCEAGEMESEVPAHLVQSSAFADRLFELVLMHEVSP